MRCFCSSTLHKLSLMASPPSRIHARRYYSSLSLSFPICYPVICSNLFLLRVSNFFWFFFSILIGPRLRYWMQLLQTARHCPRRRRGGGRWLRRLPPWVKVLGNTLTTLISWWTFFFLFIRTISLINILPFSWMLRYPLCDVYSSSLSYWNRLLNSFFLDRLWRIYHVLTVIDVVREHIWKYFV